MSKILVAYFSASGVTAKLAEVLAYVLKADLFEIKPKTPYTEADLDWRNPESRSSIEMKDKSSRPAIAETLGNMKDYDTVYVGFPIWWYVAPTIINTFLEQYDLSGKTIIPFATSGSSCMGETNAVLMPSCPGAILLDGKVWKVPADKDELSVWTDGFKQ